MRLRVGVTNPKLLLGILLPDCNCMASHNLGPCAARRLPPNRILGKLVVSRSRCFYYGLLRWWLCQYLYVLEVILLQINPVIWRLENTLICNTTLGDLSRQHLLKGNFRQPLGRESTATDFTHLLVIFDSGYDIQPLIFSFKYNFKEILVKFQLVKSPDLLNMFEGDCKNRNCWFVWLTFVVQ